MQVESTRTVLDQYKELYNLISLNCFILVHTAEDKPQSFLPNYITS